MQNETLDSEEKKQIPWYVQVSRAGLPNDNWLIGFTVFSAMVLITGIFMPSVRIKILFIGGSFIAGPMYFISYLWLKKHNPERSKKIR